MNEYENAKQAFEGLAMLMRGITGNQSLTVPDEVMQTINRNQSENYFRYSKDEINQIISEYREAGLKKVSMRGVYNDLQELKSIIENLYKDKIFHLSDFDDAIYHGWKGEDIREIGKITDGIERRINEIYALILIGLGENGFESEGTTDE